MTATESARGGPGSALDKLASSLGTTELRPALTRSYSAKTLRCYAQRLRHYQAWCAAHGQQTGVEFIDDGLLDAYVADQVVAQELRPSTLRQAVNSLLYYAERAGRPVPDDRAAKEMVRRYAAACEADGIPPAYRVVGRRSPRPRQA